MAFKYFRTPEYLRTPETVSGNGNMIEAHEDALLKEGSTGVDRMEQGEGKCGWDVIMSRAGRSGYLQ